MKLHQYLTIAVALGVLLLLFTLGNTIPPAKKPATMPQARGGAGAENRPKPASGDSLLLLSQAQLPGKEADSVLWLKKQLTEAKPARQAELYKSMARIMVRNKKTIAGNYFAAAAAKLEKSAKQLTFTAQLYLELMQNEPDPSVQLWEVNEAVACLELSEKIDSTYEDTKLALATAYIEGTGEPMKGVQILKGITNKNPDDIPANMLLGRMSIQSGQFDKAVKRFETILNKEPNNKEAIYFLAQAYEGLGNKKKAIELLEKCKQMVDNPDFKKELDAKIKTLQ
ncbi:MAG: hypothetical protein EBX41_06875 [Chitinophagia bacterium]|nr:hypothetical protein [Chitinophagia bacterium]